MNYSKEMTQDMVSCYQEAPNRTTVAILAERYGKSEKSIIGKLSKEGVYQRQEYKTKAGEKPITKAEIVANIANEVGENLEGLEKAPKEVLKRLWSALCED
tara:strand:+ start:622 stop:924 length:303 start_codon:yes stop_codon:yes gene_type:complete